MIKGKGSYVARLGIISRREKYALTMRGWGVLVLLIALASVSIIYNLNRFLAPVKPVNANVLVVEGWIPEYEFAEAIREFRDGRYSKLYTTGGPLRQGFFLSDYRSDATLSAASLIKLGLGKDSVTAVPAPFVIKDRTYESALAFRRWLDSSGVALHAFNIFTLGAHGRRTRMLFKEAFGDTVNVGIISASDLAYDPKHWWTSSQGVREVVDESVAYLYAKFLFRP